MQELQAIKYGKIELIPGIKCDGYILSDGSACLSEHGTANLFGMKHTSLQSVAVKSVIVIAENSPHKGRKINVYSSLFIESFIRSYALAFANEVLRPNQKHVVKRCSILNQPVHQTTT